MASDNFQIQQPTSSDNIIDDYFPSFDDVLKTEFTRKNECYLEAFATNVAPNTTVLLHRNTVNSVLPIDLHIESTKDYVVARIISFQDDKIVVNLYDYFLDNTLHKKFRIQPMNSNHGACHNVVEVVQTLRRAVVPDSAIFDAAFIFTVDEIEVGGISCQMISNCFVVRFRYDYLTHTHNLFDCCRASYVPSLVGKDHYFAPSIISKKYEPTMQCFIASLWSKIIIMQSFFFSALNRAFEHQGSYSTYFGKINIDVLFWKYIFDKTCHCVIPFKKTVSKKRSIILQNLTRKSFQIIGEETILRFETIQQLHALASIIGVCCYHGVRRKRPPIREEQKILASDTINAVPGAATIESKTNPYTTNPGIDLIYYSDSCKSVEIFAKLRYCNIVNDDDFEYNDVWPDLSKNNDGDESMDDNNIINVGTLLQVDGTVFEIIYVSEREATIKTYDETEETIETRTFPRSEFNYLKEMIMGYNFL